MEDPLNYGLFPDALAVNLLLDDLYEKGAYKGSPHPFSNYLWPLQREVGPDGAEVAAYLMRQEMWDNPLSVRLGLLCVAKLLEARLAGAEPPSCRPPPPEAAQDEEEEEVGPEAWAIERGGEGLAAGPLQSPLAQEPLSGRAL